MERQISKILKDISYRNFKFYTSEIAGYCEIHINADLPDTDNPSETVCVHMKSELLPLVENEALVIDTVMSLIAKLEEHERKEWFKYKGKAIFHPHYLPRK